MTDKVWLYGSDILSGLYLKQQRVVNGYYTWVEKGGYCIYSTPSGRWAVTNDARDFCQGQGHAHSEHHYDAPPNLVEWDSGIRILDDAQKHHEAVLKQQLNSKADRESLLKSSLQLLDNLKRRESEKPSDGCVRCGKSITNTQMCVYHPGPKNEYGIWLCCGEKSTERRGCVTVPHTSLRTEHKRCCYCGTTDSLAECVPREHVFEETVCSYCSNCRAVSECGYCRSSDIVVKDATAVSGFEIECGECLQKEPLSSLLSRSGGGSCPECGHSSDIKGCTLTHNTNSTDAELDLVCPTPSCLKSFHTSLPSISCNSCSSFSLKLSFTTNASTTTTFECNRCHRSSLSHGCPRCNNTFIIKNNTTSVCIHCSTPQQGGSTVRCKTRQHEWVDSTMVLRRCTECGTENTSSDPCHNGKDHQWARSEAIHKVISPRRAPLGPHHYHLTVSEGNRLEVTKMVCLITGKTGSGKPFKTVVYCYSHHTAERLAGELATSGVETFCIHGGLSKEVNKLSWEGFSTTKGERSKVLMTVSLLQADMSGVDVVVHCDLLYPLFDNLKSFPNVRPCCGSCLTSTIISKGLPILEVSGSDSNTLTVFSNCIDTFKGISLLIASDSDTKTLDLLKANYKIEEAPHSSSIADLLRGDGWYQKSSILCRT